MSYEFIKLSDVEIVETSQTANLLIEEDGEIKRLPVSNFDTIPNVQADWNETDDTSPAFIVNKPEISGGGKVINFSVDSGVFMADGESLNAQQVVDKWRNGEVLRYNCYGTECQIINVSFSTGSGTEEIISTILSYIDPEEGMLSSIEIF